jgi:hypothetical protein
MVSGSFTGLVLRSSATGTPIETLTPASQFDEVLLSNGPFDVTKVNQFFIDINPAGRIRFGALDNSGVKRLLHTIGGLNTSATLFAGNFELPLRAELINETATAGTTELRIFDAEVYTQSEIDEERLVNIRSHADAGFTTLTGSNHHVITIRPTTEFKGQTNRVVSLLDELHVAMPNSGNSIIRTKILKNAQLLSSSWSAVQSNRSSLEQSTISGTYVIDSGELIFSSYASNTTTISIRDHVTYLREFLSLDWDGAQNSSYSVVYDLVTGSAVDVYTTLDAREVQ